MDPQYSSPAAKQPLTLSVTRKLLVLPPGSIYGPSPQMAIHQNPNMIGRIATSNVYLF